MVSPVLTEWGNAASLWLCAGWFDGVGFMVCAEVEAAGDAKYGLSATIVLQETRPMHSAWHTFQRSLRALRIKLCSAKLAQLPGRREAGTRGCRFSAGVPNPPSGAERLRQIRRGCRRRTVEGGPRHCCNPRYLGMVTLRVTALHCLPKRAASRWAASFPTAAGSSLAARPEKIDAGRPILWRGRMNSPSCHGTAG